MYQHRKAGEALESIPSEGVEYNLKVASWETGGVYEVWEMVWDKGVVVPYHEHHSSQETFHVVSGSVEITLAGNKFIANPGDIIHVQPYMPHAMKFLEDTTWIAYFQGYKFYNVMQERNALKEHNPDALQNEEFIAEFAIRHDSHSVKSPEQIVQETKV